MTGGNKMEHEQHSSINDILHHYKEGKGIIKRGECLIISK